MAASSSSHNPAFVFCPGVSHTPLFYQPLLSQLAEYGFDGTAVQYPTVGYNTTGTSFADEVTAIHDAVSHYVDGEARNVILFTHSYGGWPGSRAVKGWDIDSRRKEGKETGIIGLVTMASLLPPEDAPVAVYNFTPDWVTNEVSSAKRSW